MTKTVTHADTIVRMEHADAQEAKNSEMLQ